MTEAQFSPDAEKHRRSNFMVATNKKAHVGEQRGQGVAFWRPSTGRLPVTTRDNYGLLV
jgi:hypothetical protein